MGNSLRRIILAPAVPYEDVVRFAEALRAAQVPALLTYCTLDSSTPRRVHVRAAKQAGVRVVEIDTPARSESLLSIADETLPGEVTCIDTSTMRTGMNAFLPEIG